MDKNHQVILIKTFMGLPTSNPFNLAAFANLLFGASDKFSLEHRFLNGSLILGGMTALSSVIFNIALNLGIYLQLLTAGTTILLFGLYYFTRIHRGAAKAVRVFSRLPSYLRNR